ncbi:MAG: prepilin-type N-terminal cleavage/methylation domain-containing protein [Proteobacteria bacterium]|nr:prepilin-type N-terminal cleavage/methylation domain-containing protein [Pseudomonadota bacterium]
MKFKQYPFSPHCYQKGFTLLELLLTVVILALMVGIMGGVLRLGIRSWEKGEETVDEFRKTRIVMEMIAQQIKSTYPYMIKKEKGWAVIFQGEPKALKFVSPISVKSPVITGLVWVQYALGEDRASENGKELIIRESMISGDDFFQKESEITKDETVDITLLSNLDDIMFDYYVWSPDSDEGEWRESWNGETEEDTMFPQAVRIKLTHRPKNSDDAEPMTTAMTIPIMVADLDRADLTRVKAAGRGGLDGFFPSTSMPQKMISPNKKEKQGPISPPFGSSPGSSGGSGGGSGSPFYWPSTS